MDELLAALRALFVKLFQPFLTTFVASLRAVSSGKAALETAVSWDFRNAFEGWDTQFDDILRMLEGKAAQVCSRTTLLEAVDFGSMSVLDVGTQISPQTKSADVHTS